ncbi:MAG: hypothetical protein Q7S00_05585 [bacterium]|nr:hypothetical protein [bacterium]
MATIRPIAPNTTPVYHQSGSSLLTGQPINVTANKTPDQLRQEYALNSQQLNHLLRHGHGGPNRNSGPGDVGEPS